MATTERLSPLVRMTLGAVVSLLRTRVWWVLVITISLVLQGPLQANAHYDPEGHAGVSVFSPVRNYGSCAFRVMYDSSPVFHAVSYVQEIDGCAYVQADLAYRDYGYWQYAGGSYTYKEKYCSAQTSSYECAVYGELAYTNLTAKVRACGTYQYPWYICGSTGWFYP